MKIANCRMIIAALALLSGASAFGASGSVMADKTTGALAAPANFFTANAAAIQAVVGAAGQTPWTTDIDADGRALTNVASISSGSSNPFLLTMGDRAPSTAGYKQAQMAVPTNSITTNYVMLLPNNAFDGLGYLERAGGPDTNPVVRWRKGVAADIPTGAGVTNSGGVIAANLAAGANITITTGASGQQTIAASGGGGSSIILQVSNGGALFNDSTTYYLGVGWGVGLDANQGRYSHQVAKAGTITGYTFSAGFGTLGTGESVTIDLWLNNTTSVGSTTTTFDTAYRTVTVTGLSQAITTSDKLEARIVGPVWATNPNARFARFDVQVQ